MEREKIEGKEIKAWKNVYIETNLKFVRKYVRFFTRPILPDWPSLFSISGIGLCVYVCHPRWSLFLLVGFTDPNLHTYSESIWWKLFKNHKKIQMTMTKTTTKTINHFHRVECTPLRDFYFIPVSPLSRKHPSQLPALSWGPSRVEDFRLVSETIYTIVSVSTNLLSEEESLCLYLWKSALVLQYIFCLLIKSVFWKKSSSIL